jgi:hypothetical protein
MELHWTSKAGLPRDAWNVSLLLTLTGGFQWRRLFAQS